MEHNSDEDQDNTTWGWEGGSHGGEGEGQVNTWGPRFQLLSKPVGKHDTKRPSRILVCRDENFVCDVCLHLTRPYSNPG